MFGLGSGGNFLRGTRAHRRSQPAKEQDRGGGAQELRANEVGCIGRTNARKRVAQRSREGTGGIGERGGRREPVRRGDIGSNGDTERGWRGRTFPKSRRVARTWR